MARLSVKFPVVLERIARNELTMTNASLLAPHLTQANYLELIRDCLGKGRVEVEKIIVCHFPKPDIEESLRKLPEPRTFGAEGKPRPGTSLALATPGTTLAPLPPRPELVQALSEKRTKFEFSGDEALVAMYRTLQDRLRRQYPKGRMEDLEREAFKLLMDKTDPTREPKRKRSLPASKPTRRPATSVRREVWKRDGSRCTFVSKNQTRCDATAFLELDHVIPWSLGGSSRTSDDFTLRCRAHNAWRGGARSVASPPVEG